MRTNNGKILDLYVHVNLNTLLHTQFGLYVLCSMTIYYKQLLLYTLKMFLNVNS